MHPDDVRERDIAWLKGPDPKLPSLHKIEGMTFSFVGFDGQFYGSKVARMTSEYAWAVGDENVFDRSFVAMARLDLLLSWPEPGESLDRWVKALEDELNRTLGIGNQPAVSMSPGGDSEKPKTKRPKAIRCVGCRNAAAVPGEPYCDACHKLLQEAIRRQRDVLHSLSCYGYLAEGAVHKGVVGVIIRGQFQTAQRHADFNVSYDKFMPLRQADNLVRQIENDIEKQKALDDYRRLHFPSAKPPRHRSGR